MPIRFDDIDYDCLAAGVTFVRSNLKIRCKLPGALMIKEGRLILVKLPLAKRVQT